MKFFKNLFGNKNVEISAERKNHLADHVILLSDECINSLEQGFKPTNQNGKFEIFMLNLEFFTQFLLDHNYIKDEQDFRFLLVFKLMSYPKNPLANKTNEDFLEYYSSRTALINFEIKSLVKAMKAGKKMFIPVFSYVSIYETPLINEPDVSFSDFNNDMTFDAIKMHYASDFMVSYSKHLNFIANRINSIFPAV